MDNFIEELKKIDNEDSGLDFIFDTFDDMLLKQEFKKCDKILKDINVSDFNITLLVGFLTITINWKNNLKNRADFYNRAEISIKEQIFNKREVYDILDGLK